MTVAKPRFSTFEAYLTYDDGTDNRYELINGELVELPPEAEPNSAITTFLLVALMNAGVSLRLIKPYTCEIQVPVIQTGDTQNRYPDLVVLREQHLALTQKRLTITLDMPPPRLIIEVVSPGKTNRDRDYTRKRAQYCEIGVSEYWIVDPEQQTVLVLELQNNQYAEVGRFKSSDQIVSPHFSSLKLTPEEIFAEAQ